MSGCQAVLSILHTVGMNWNSRSEIDTTYTGKCDVALNNKRVHEGRPPGPCINCKREDVTKRYWHLSQRRDQPLFYTFVKNAYAFKFLQFVFGKSVLSEIHVHVPGIIFWQL
jgi:hypothetical protein